MGDHERPDHYHLPGGSKCFFWGEYTPQKHIDGPVWEYSATNRLITNFKKKMDKAGQYEWRYKLEAINTIAGKFATSWKWADIVQTHNLAVIPMPPSKRRNDPMYDPRMLQVVNGIAARAGVALDIRDCLTFSGKFAASHESEDRPTPDDLYEELSFCPTAGKAQQPPGTIFLFDDMLTTGAHYVAAARLLAEVFPGVPVIGNFIARRIVPNPFADLSDFDDL